MAAGLTRINFTGSDAMTVSADFAARLSASPPGTPEGFDATARRYLETLFTTPVNAGFSEATSEEQSPNQLLTNINYTGLEEIHLTETVVAEYEQKWRGIPIYGARIGVEMTRDKELVNVSGHVAPPVDINPLATLSPLEGYRIVKQIAGVPDYRRLNFADAPQLLFRYDEENNNWSLAYLFDGVPLVEDDSEPGDSSGGPNSGAVTNIFKVFIDAHSGEEIARIPRIHTLGPVDATGRDVDGNQHNFTALEDNNGQFILEDPGRKIRTFSMKSNSIDCGSIQIPGERVSSSSATFSHVGAVVAHANATRVYDFYFNLLRRNSVDDRGLPLISCVDCLDFRKNRLGMCLPPDDDARQKVYKNAAWYRDTGDPSPFIKKGVMVYGQVKGTGTTFRSFAQSLDVVGHELTHGVTSYTCDLDYVTESGALNESYSDIFGVTISNAHENDVSRWNWELGEELFSDHRPFRDMSNPRSFGQPDHMRDFKRLAPGERPSEQNDVGFVHGNSGIHNKAAFNLFTNGVMPWQDVIKLFYLTLTTHGRLVQTSKFADSKAGMLASCQSLFAARLDFEARKAAIREAFEDVGIF